MFPNLSLFFYISISAWRMFLLCFSRSYQASHFEHFEASGLSPELILLLPSAHSTPSLHIWHITNEIHVSFIQPLPSQSQFHTRIYLAVYGEVHLISSIKTSESCESSFTHLFSAQVL